MEYRAFRDTGLKTSLLGMGTMRLPKLPGENTKIDWERAQRVIDCAYENGINYFDTAAPYHGGEAESFLGAALRKYPRDSYFFANKISGWFCPSREQAEEFFHDQLKKCGVEYFDFYLVHNLSEQFLPLYDNDYMIPMLNRFRAEGLIRHLGFSSHAGVDTLRYFAGLNDWDFAQIQLNYFDWDFQDARTQYAILREKGLPIMVMEPLRGGLLSSLTPEADRVFLEAEPDRSVASWGFRWVAGQEGIQVVLSGMGDTAQVLDNVRTFSDMRPIDAGEQAVIDRALEIMKAHTLVPCTACRYCCSECPQELDIPGLIAVKNEQSLSRINMCLGPVRDMPEERQPKSCLACGACMEHCPQHIDIPAVMADLADAVSNFVPPGF